MTAAHPPPPGTQAVSALALADGETTVASFDRVALTAGEAAYGEGTLTCTSR